MFRHLSRPIILSLSVMALSCAADKSGRVTDIGDVDPPAGAVVSGTVLDTDGQPRSGAVVTLERVSNGIPASIAALLDASQATQLGLSKAATERATTSDDDGRYAFDGLDVGAWRLEAQARDHLARIQEFRVAAAAAAVGDTIIVDVALTPVASYSGVATLENATDHGGTLVYVEGTSNVGVTDPAGNWRVDNVPLGSHSLRAEHPRYIHRDLAGSLSVAGEVAALAPVELRLNSNILPVAEAGGPYTGTQGDPVQFIASGSDLDGSVVFYEWDFEDDGTWDFADSTTATTSHIYTAVGNFLARLRVTDDDGDIGVDVGTVVVTSSTIFLSTTGNDLNPGTSQFPVATLQSALTLAVANNASNVYAAIGTYTTNGLIDLIDGVNIMGGRSPSTWADVPGGVSTFSGSALVLRGTGINSPTVVRRIHVLQNSAPTVIQPSIALWLNGSSANLLFEFCEFSSANGRIGSPGNGGSHGVPGGVGSSGGFGSCDGGHGNGGAGGSSVAGCPGGAGGRGGLESGGGALAGSSGGCGGGTGGGGGNTGDPGQPGANGVNGSNGASGSHGSSASSQGTVVAGMWAPNTSAAGTDGADGRGGGGGGGGGGQSCTFCNNGGGNGGGGGGGGGQGSTAGTGGQGGWASFAVFANNSPSVFVGCTFNSGSGGPGGNGRSAGVEGAGGNGGFGANACTAEIGAGGDGGDGGRGGRGGGGAGGPGGPSYGLCYRGSIPTLTTPTYNPSAGGSGGSGGQGRTPTSNAPTGITGASGSVLQR